MVDKNQHYNSFQDLTQDNYEDEG